MSTERQNLKTGNATAGHTTQSEDNMSGLESNIADSERTPSKQAGSNMGGSAEGTQVAQPFKVITTQKMICGEFDAQKAAMLESNMRNNRSQNDFRGIRSYIDHDSMSDLQYILSVKHDDALYHGKTLHKLNSLDREQLKAFHRFWQTRLTTEQEHKLMADVLPKERVQILKAYIKGILDPRWQATSQLLHDVEKLITDKKLPDEYNAFDGSVIYYITHLIAFLNNRFYEVQLARSMALIYEKPSSRQKQLRWTQHQQQ